MEPLNKNGRLISIDGLNDGAVLAEARRLARWKGAVGISRWDASGIFHELAAADEDDGAPSARVLLLLYAADLAFRMRWEIAPALAKGRAVIAAPYVDTAVAFGRAAGVDGAWMKSLFSFAPRARESHRVSGKGRRPSAGHQKGFVEFASTAVPSPLRWSRTRFVAGRRSSDRRRPA